jgi:hypothetical protein
MPESVSALLYRRNGGSTVSLDSLRQRLAGHQFHHQIMHAAAFLQPMDRDNVPILK